MNRGAGSDGGATGAATPEAIDIAPFASGNLGVSFVHRIDSGRPGPVVAVTALTHGNEVAGAAVLARLLAGCGTGPRAGELRLTAGALILVFANYRAYGGADTPARRFIDRDLNRVWDPSLLDGPDTGWELERARQLRPVFAEVDCLLDLHTTATDDPPFLICSTKPAARRLCAALEYVERRVLFERPMHSGRMLIEADAFIDPDSPRVGLVAECGLHESADAAKTAWAITASFLKACGVADATASWPGALRSARYFVARQLIVPQSGEFHFVRPFTSFEAIGVDEVYARDAGRDLVPGFDRAVMLMPRLSPRAGAEAGLLAQEIAD